MNQGISHATGDFYKFMNCLFCFCPLYDFDCPGNYTIIDKGDRKVKSCKNCNFPHMPDNYDKVMEYLKNRSTDS